MTREASFLAEISVRHGSRPDLRIWRNPRGLYYAGEPVGRTKEGHLILRGARPVKAGLANGAGDMIGLRAPYGQFISLEGKTDNVTMQKNQKKWQAMVRKFGGIAEEVRTMDDVDSILGVPPK